MDELLHQSVVSGHDHDQVVAVILHGLQKRVNGLLAEVVFALSGGQRIGFVDEQHAAHGGLDHLGGLLGRLAHVSGHQTGAIHLHKLPLGQQVQAVIDARHQPGDHGLAGARIAGKHHVQAHVRSLQPLFPAQRVYRGQVDQVVDLALDGGQPHIAVQLGLQIINGLLRLRLDDGIRRGRGLNRSSWRIAGGGRAANAGRGSVCGGRIVCIRGMGRGGGSAEEVRADPAQIVLRHDAQRLKLRLNDFVPVVHIWASSSMGSMHKRLPPDGEALSFAQKITIFAPGFSDCRSALSVFSGMAIQPAVDSLLPLQCRKMAEPLPGTQSAL